MSSLVSPLCPSVGWFGLLFRVLCTCCILKVTTNEEHIYHIIKSYRDLVKQIFTNLVQLLSFGLWQKNMRTGQWDSESDKIILPIWNWLLSLGQGLSATIFSLLIMSSILTPNPGWSLTLLKNSYLAVYSTNPSDMPR